MYRHFQGGTEAERIECFVEGYAAFRSLILFSLSDPDSKLPLFLNLYVCRRSSLLTGDGGGGGGGRQGAEL